jgi:TRAP transporter TAXI family solute receptor
MNPMIFICALLMVIVFGSPSLATGQERFHFFASLGTGEMNGVYYPVGGAICDIVNRDIRTTGVRCSRETTPGSVYNTEALRSGELEFAIIQSDVAFAAYNGTGPFLGKPFPELRTVVLLYPELVTIVARPGIREVDDLAGKRINVGPEGSGARHTWEAIQKAMGWRDALAPQVVDMSADTIGPALCSGSLDAVLLVLGHPSSKVSALLAECSLNLVSVKGPAIDTLVAGAPYLRKGSISGDLYGLTGVTVSFGVSAALMTTANMDPRVVGTFARAIGARIDELKRKQAALVNLSSSEIMNGPMPAPLHPAALQSYRELGWN